MFQRVNHVLFTPLLCLDLNKNVNMPWLSTLYKVGYIGLNLITIGNNFVLVAIAELFNPLKTFMLRYRFL